MKFDGHDYNNILCSANLPSIKFLHIQNDLCFVKNVKLGKIYSPEVIDLFENSTIPYGLGDSRGLIEQATDRNYVDNAPTNRLRRKQNKLPIVVRSMNCISPLKIS